MIGPKPRLPAILASVGLLLSILLEVLHVRTHLDPAVSSICGFGGRVDCDTVALSGASVLLGVPVALWGVVGFGAILFACLRRPAWVLPLAVVAAIASVVYALVSIFAVGSICVFCEAAHATALLLLWAAWRTRDLAASREALRSYRSVLAGLGAPAVVLAALRLLLPPYWTIASWEAGISLETGVDEEGRPWIGAIEPKIVVHEYIDYYCPHCRLAHGRMRMRVAAHPDEIRIVRHQMPRMSCAPAKRPGSQRCHAARIALCAGEQGKFWEMDDWLVTHGPDRGRVDAAEAARAVGVEAGRLQRCVEDARTWERADRDVAEARRRGIEGTPAYVIDGRLLKHTQADEAIDEKL